MTWYPIGSKERKSRTKTSWMDGICETMGEMEFMEEDSRDREKR